MAADEPRPPGGPPVGRRQFLAGTGLGGAAAVAGCSGLWRPRADPTPGRVTLEYVDVAGTRSRELFQPVLDELDRRGDATIELEVTEIPFENMKRQLLTRVGGGNVPDIAAIDQVWLGEFIDGDALLPLDEIVDDIEFDDHLPAFRSPVEEQGHTFGIPITTDVRGMYWNKDLFERAGLDPETPPTTWSGLFDVASQVHDPPETYGAAYFVGSGRWTVSLFAAGGDVLSEDGTEPTFHERPGVAAASFVDELYNERAVSSPEPVYQDGAQLAREFLSGQYAITLVEGSWLDYFWRNLGNEDGTLVERFGFAPTPRPEGRAPATMSGGFTWGGFAETDHPEIVRDFLRVAGGREFKRHLAVETGDLPTRESLLDDAEIWDGVLYGDTVKELLRGARTRPIRHWSVVEEALDPALQRIAFDRATPEVALEEAAAQVRTALE